MGGGEVIPYVKENFKVKVLHKSNTAQPGKPLKPEYILCALGEGNAAPTLNVLIYSRPDVFIRADRKLVELLRSTCSAYSHKIIMGDWNTKILDSDSSDSRFVRGLTD